VSFLPIFAAMAALMYHNAGSARLLLISNCPRSTGQSGATAKKPFRTSRGLHATLIGRAETSNGPPFESVTFRLINDADQPMSSSTRTWTLVIDGREWPESQNMFNNGGRPAGGYDAVLPGREFHFGYELPLARFFPEDRDYQVYWRSEKFRSNVITVRGAAVP
jgi:hypothetical protein